MPKLQAKARLREVFKHWKDAAASYHDPEGFRISLNSCIQALRNVTFILQKQKSEINNFETWYSNWQRCLKQDPILSWCVAARNLIVKEGDLKTESMAIASLVISYNRSPENEFKVDPTLSNKAIAKLISKKYLPKALQKYGYLRVERVWRVEELKNVELLDALAHAFSILGHLVNDAIKQIGPSILENENDETKNQDNDNSVLNPRFDLFAPCMSEFSEYRVSWLKLSTDQFSYIKTYTGSAKGLPNVSEEFKKEVEKIKLKNKTDLFETAQYFLEIGKIILKKQGFHFPTLILFDRKKRPSLLHTEFPDNEDKPLVWESLAKEIKKRKTTSVIFIAEIWMAPLNALNPFMRASESPDRKEAIQAFGAKTRGSEFMITVPFYRENDDVKFEIATISHDVWPDFFEPVRRRWKKRRLQKS